MKRQKGHPEFLKIIEELKELHSNKNTNYATDEDPLSNLKKCEELGIPGWKGVIIRMGDKWSRLIELTKGKPDMVGESFVDTLRDMAVYSMLCEILYKEDMKKNK